GPGCVSRRCLFFFQAEDGIRDFHVTGVQTCALPISFQFAKAVGPFANGEALVLGLRRNSCEIDHSPRRLGLMDTSSMVAEPLPRSEERRVGKGARPPGSAYQRRQSTEHTPGRTT